MRDTGAMNRFGVGVVGALALLMCPSRAVAQTEPYPPQPLPMPTPQPLPPPGTQPAPPPPQYAPAPAPPGYAPAPQPLPAPPPAQYAPPAQPQYAPAPQYAPPPQYAPAPPPGYAPAPQPLPAPYGAPPPVPQPAPPTYRSRRRSDGEMGFLYGTSVAYGIGSGVWIDALIKETDPGIAVIAPAALGAAVPIGMYVWDYFDEFDRAVPSTIATGMLLGAVEGVAVSGLQWQLTGHQYPQSWNFKGETTATFIATTAGGVGGYFFGEFLQPNPRSLAFIASGAAWGTANGVLLGGGVVSSTDHIADGAAVWGFAGYNAGMLATGIVSTVYTPSWATLKYMWLGDVLGTVATTPVYLFYIGSDAEKLHHGMIANAVGGLAGLAIAAVLTANMTDGPDAASWTPPFQVGVSPTHGGAFLQAFGQF